VNAVSDAVSRLMTQARGETGYVMVLTETGMSECVLVRREDLDLLLATWSEKRG